MRSVDLRDNSMTTVRISGGVVHNLPADLRKAVLLAGLSASMSVYSYRNAAIGSMRIARVTGR